MQAFSAELASLLRIVYDRRLAWLALATMVLLSLSTQLAPRYSIDIGQEDGPGADLPLIRGFNTPEHDAHGTFRWTSAASFINLSGFGSRSLFLSLHLFPVNDEIATRGPQTFELWLGARQLAVLPVYPKGRSYHVLLPPTPQGELVLGLRSATIVPSGDERALGIVLDRVLLTGQPGALPAWPSLMGWLLALLLAWLVLRRLGYTSEAGAFMLMPCLVLLGLAAVLDAPRLNIGMLPALQTLALALGLVLAICAAPASLGLLGTLLVGTGIIFGDQAADVLYPAALILVLAALLRRSAVRIWDRLESGQEVVGSGQTEILHVQSAACRRGTAPYRFALLPPQFRALALLVVLTFALHYGGKIYPFSMPGDIGFHVNRFREAIEGRIFILSKNRGVDFPYPPALYVMLAPLTLLSSRRELLQLSAALMDAISPLLLYLVARRSGLLHSWQAAVGAAGLYALSGALLMTTWWNFSTHIFAQFAHLVLITVLVCTQGRSSASAAGTWLRVVLLIFLQLILYLGHFGFWMNMSLVAAMGLLVLGWQAVRQHGRRQHFLVIFASVLFAQLITVLLFYSAYTGLFLAQLGSTASGGFTGLAGRAAVPATILWAGLIEGLYAHLGMLPILLSPLALLLPMRSASAQTASQAADLPAPQLTRMLMLTSFVLGAVFAALPFVTGSTLSTRWLMFCLWAICVAFAALSERLWLHGRGGRLLVLAISAFVLWNSAIIWLGALAWRVRPPEPF